MFFSAQSGRTSSRVTLPPSYTKQFSSWRSIKLLGRAAGRLTWKVSEKNIQRSRGNRKRWLGTTILPSIFSADLSNVYCKVLYLMYAISTLLLLVAGKASRVPRVTSYFSSIVE